MNRKAKMWLAPALAFAALLGFRAFGETLPNPEVLVLASAATAIPAMVNQTGLEIYNNGPNVIWCALYDSTKAVTAKSRPVYPGGSWSFPARYQDKIYCIAASADQVTGAATIVTRLRRSP